MDELTAMLQDTADAVKGLPEHLQEVAFRVVLERRLGSAASSWEGQSAPPDSPPTSNGVDRPGWLDRVLDGLPEPHEAADMTRSQQTVWAVATLAGEGELATTGSVRDVIRTRLGVSPQGRGNTSKTLGDLTPRYLTRKDREDGQGYVYKPTVKALEVFED